MALVALTAYAVDITTKVLAVERLDGRPDVPLLGDVLVLHLTRNPGAAFSTGTAYTEILSVLSITAICVVLWVSRRLGSRLWAVGLDIELVRHLAGREAEDADAFCRGEHDAISIKSGAERCYVRELDRINDPSRCVCRI